MFLLACPRIMNDLYQIHTPQPDPKNLCKVTQSLTKIFNIKDFESLVAGERDESGAGVVGRQLLHIPKVSTKMLHKLYSLFLLFPKLYVAIAASSDDKVTPLNKERIIIILQQLSSPFHIHFINF